MDEDELEVLYPGLADCIDNAERLSAIATRAWEEAHDECKDLLDLPIQEPMYTQLCAIQARLRVFIDVARSLANLPLSKPKDGEPA